MAFELSYVPASQTRGISAEWWKCFTLAYFVGGVLSSQGMPGPPGEKGESGDVGPMVRVICFT